MQLRQLSSESVSSSHLVNILFQATMGLCQQGIGCMRRCVEAPQKKTASSMAPTAAQTPPGHPIETFPARRHQRRQWVLRQQETSAARPRAACRRFSPPTYSKLTWEKR